PTQKVRHPDIGTIKKHSVNRGEPGYARRAPWDCFSGRDDRDHISIRDPYAVSVKCKTNRSKTKTANYGCHGPGRQAGINHVKISGSLRRCSAGHENTPHRCQHPGRARRSSPCFEKSAVPGSDARYGSITVVRYPNVVSIALKTLRTGTDGSQTQSQIPVRSRRPPLAERRPPTAARQSRVERPR